QNRGLGTILRIVGRRFAALHGDSSPELALELRFFVPQLQNQRAVHADEGLRQRQVEQLPTSEWEIRFVPVIYAQHGSVRNSYTGSPVLEVAQLWPTCGLKPDDRSVSTTEACRPKTDDRRPKPDD